MAEFVAANRNLPLAGFHGGSASVRIDAAAPAFRISLRAEPEARVALSEALNVDLPWERRTSIKNGSRRAMWLGPDEWLVTDEAAGGLVSACAAAGVVHSAVDISHRNTAVLVSGPGAENALNAGCPLDLSMAEFPVGAVVRTVFGKAEIVLLRTASDSFRVECWRSFADYVSGLLDDAARDAAF